MSPQELSEHQRTLVEQTITNLLALSQQVTDAVSSEDWEGAVDLTSIMLKVAQIAEVVSK